MASNAARSLVDTTLTGAKPADLPVEEPTTLEPAQLPDAVREVSRMDS